MMVDKRYNVTRASLTVNGHFDAPDATDLATDLATGPENRSYVGSGAEGSVL